MENNENRRIEIEQDSLDHLNTIRKWTMFFSVIGSIFIGLMIIAGIVAGAFLSIFETGEMGTGISRWIMMSFILVIALIYFFPVLFLFRFSIHTRNAVQSTSKEELRLALKNLKSYFVYIGVLVIIGLAFYFIALAIAGTSMAFLKNYW